MSELSVDEFDQELECQYEGEFYVARDNGAVLRKPRPSGKIRLIDNRWTFGLPNKSNPYLHIAGVRIHRIIAVAFHGLPPEPYWVVDHIDTNCRNNRPENLRWLTRLENVLKNPITRKKIEYLCGSIEAFLENPSMLNDLRGNTNFSWMRTVSEEEAQYSKIRMHLWIQHNQGKKSELVQPTSGITEQNLFRPLQKWEAGLTGEPGLDFSLTPSCAQYMWGSPVYFPCCPQNTIPNSVEKYYDNIKVGDMFAFNDSDLFPRLIVHEKKINPEEQTVCVLCSRNDNAWTIVGFFLNEKAHFIHFQVGSFNELEDARTVFVGLKKSNDFWSKSHSATWQPK